MYLAIREHKVNESQQVNILIKVKFESKVAKTFWLVDLGVDILVYPGNCFYYLTHAICFPSHSHKWGIGFWITTEVTLWNYLFNRLLYCYTDRRFRNTIAQLL